MNRRCGRKGIVIARRTVTGLVEPHEVVVRARHLVLRGRPRRRDELPELRERDLIAPVLVRLEPQAIEDRALVRVRGVVPSHVVAVQAVPELLIRQVSVPVRVEREEEVAKDVLLEARLARVARHRPSPVASEGATTNDDRMNSRPCQIESARENKFQRVIAMTPC